MLKSMSIIMNGKKYPIPFNPETGEALIDLTAPLQTSGMNNSGQGPGIGEAARGFGFYPLSIEVTDYAGNRTTIHYNHQTYGNKCRLYVYENTKPAAELMSESGVIRENTFPIRLLVSDYESGINPNTIRLTLNDEEIPVEPSAENDVTYSAEHIFEDLEDGDYVLKLTVCDYDGNSFETSNQFTLDKYQTVTYVSDGKTVETQHIIYGEYAVPVSQKRDNYVLKGWYLHGALYDFSLPVLHDIILEAKWKLIDNRQYILNILQEEWLDYNAPRPSMPTLNIHTADARSSVLECRQISETVSPVGIGYITQDRRVSLSITIRGSNQAMVMAQANETMRCLQSRRGDPGGGFDLLRVEGIMNVENGHNYARITVDCTLLTYSENID